MNELFVVIIILLLVYRYFNLGNTISAVLSTIKYVRMGISLLVPINKGSVTYLRGGFIQIKYTDPNQFDDNEGVSVLLPYAVPAKQWNKVFQITVESYEQYLSTRPSSTDSNELNNDISSVAGEKVNVESDFEDKFGVNAVKRQLKECEKQDITDKMLRMAGPGKDFFGIQYIVKELVPGSKGLIFLYGHKSKTFLSHQLVQL